MPDFLLEIGLEEIPARMIDGAEAELSRRLSDLLTRDRLKGDSRVEAFSTPRRLSVLARGISAAQPDAEEQVLGPSFKVAFKDGQPTPAAQAFAKKVGVDVARLQKVETAKGEYLGAKVVNRGLAAADVLAETVPKEILSLYWPKSMYWRSKTERFVRPVRWLIAMLDTDVVPMELAGKPAQKGTHGHRMLSGTTTVQSAAEYVPTLERVKVMVSREARLERIRKALDAATRAVPGARWREDADLLDTVVNLTEWPSVILGNFDREFLALPEEILVTVMRDHQKYFAVEDASGKLTPHFLAVLNTDGDPQGLIRHGNERVLRARFNDARFFWENDQKISLRDRVPLLKAVTFQKDLGSYYEKTARVQELAARMSQRLGDAGVKVRPGIAHKAAWLAKADLTTELVREFTELQGIVGGLYAKVQQLDPLMPEATRQAIADAIYDQYKPESMEDRVARTLEGAVLSIADKADSIAGMFALGLQPTGSKDPFALRRQANGIVKTIAEHKLPVSLSQTLLDAYSMYADPGVTSKFQPADAYKRAISEFFSERLQFYFKDVLGFEYDVVNAVLAAGADNVVDAISRAEAVTELRKNKEYRSLALAFKRIKNILRQAAEKGVQIGDSFAADKMVSDEEKALASRVAVVAQAFNARRDKGNYSGALAELGTLADSLELFFEKIMVMVEDTSIRANRLGLLQVLQRTFSTVADFSEIVTEGK